MKEIINDKVYGMGAYGASKTNQNVPQVPQVPQDKVWDIGNIVLALLAFGLIGFLVWVRVR